MQTQVGWLVGLRFSHHARLLPCPGLAHGCPLGGFSYSELCC